MMKGHYRSVAASLAPFYLPLSVSPSSPCGQALQDMAASLASNSSLWAANMVDSWGKTLDGIGMLNFHFFGSYDECVHTEAVGVTGKYCTVKTHLTDEGRSDMPEARPWRPDTPWVRDLLPKDTRIAANSILTTSETPFSTCMPSVCTRRELQESLDTVLLPLGVEPDVTSCAVLNPTVEFTTPDVGFMAFLTFLVTLTICAALVDAYLCYTDNRHLRKGVLRYLLVFSAYTNLGKIFQVNPSSAPTTISCLHAMRVLSMAWVLYCHQILVPMIYMVNYTSYFTATKGFLSQIILNGYPSVDTFFFLSGFLVSGSILRAVKRSRGRFNVPLFLIHRFIRLVPPMGIVVGLLATVLRFLVSGPMAHFWVEWNKICQKNWWKDVLFVNNFVQKGLDCVGQTWYLAVDMQLYLVAPIIILPLYRHKNSGEAWLLLVTVLSAIIPAAITYKYDMMPTMLQGHRDTSDIYEKRYIKPYCRASPWLVGVWLGYFLFRQGNVRYKMSPLVVMAGWTLASVTGVLVVFGMYSYNQVIDPAEYDVMTQITYSGLHRLAWGAALGWMVFACHNGYGGIVNDFLSHPLWQPLSRLTYSTYLVSLAMQYLVVYRQTQPYYFTHLNTIISTVGSIFFSLIAATCISLISESPVLGLERLLLRPGAGVTTKTQIQADKDAHDASASPESSNANFQDLTDMTPPSPTCLAGEGNTVIHSVDKDKRGRGRPSRETPDFRGAAATTAL